MPFPPALLTALMMLMMLMICGCSGAPGTTAPAEPASDASAADGAPADAEGEEATLPDESMRRLNVLIYYPAVDGDGLIAETHEIFMTPTPGDRAKQILADLIAGPIGERGLRSIPAGTQLRQVYVLEDGTAYVDFSADLKQGLAGGSTKELFAVYSIVNSLALNIPEIRRVGILIDGAEIDTLNGHLDLRRPLPPNKSLIVDSREPTVARASIAERSHAG